MVHHKTLTAIWCTLNRSTEPISTREVLEIGRRHQPFRHHLRTSAGWEPHLVWRCPEGSELSGVEGHGVDDGWLVSRVAIGEVAITFFNVVIEKKTNPSPSQEFPRKLRKIQYSRSNNRSPPKLYFLDEQHLFNKNYHWSIHTGITIYFTRVILNN